MGKNMGTEEISTAMTKIELASTKRRPQNQHEHAGNQRGTKDSPAPLRGCSPLTTITMTVATPQ
jgi:hypothetical protein